MVCYYGPSGLKQGEPVYEERGKGLDTFTINKLNTESLQKCHLCAIRFNCVLGCTDSDMIPCPSYVELYRAHNMNFCELKDLYKNLCVKSCNEAPCEAISRGR